MPWMLVPLLPLLTYYGRLTDGVTLWLAWLLVPVAAWLGRRHGAQGVAATAIGALAALLPTYYADGMEFGGAPEVYVVALWVGVAAAARDPLPALIGTGRFFRHPAIFLLALILLPLSLWLGTHDFEEGASLSLSLGLRPLLLFALVLFGLAGLSTRLAVAGLVAATVAGAILRVSQLDEALSQAVSAGIDPDAPWLNRFSLHYRWDDLATLATGLACFCAGRTLQGWHAGAREGAGPWRRPLLTAAGLTLLGCCGSLVRQWLPDLPEGAAPLGLYGDYFALPVAAFMAGFLRHHLGIAVTLGVLLVLIGGNIAAAYQLERGGIGFGIEQPFLVLAFGTLGLRLRDLLDGTTTTFKAMRWVQYAILVGGVLAILSSWSDLIDLVKAVLMAVAAALFGVVVQWLRRKLEQGGIRISGAGWLPLLALLAVTLFLALNIAPIVAVLTEALDDLDFPPGMIAAGTLLLLNVPVALLAAGYATCLPKVWRDIRAMCGRT